MEKGVYIWSLDGLELYRAGGTMGAGCSMAVSTVNLPQQPQKGTALADVIQVSS